MEEYESNKSDIGSANRGEKKNFDWIPIKIREQ